MKFSFDDCPWALHQLRILWSATPNQSARHTRPANILPRPHVVTHIGRQRHIHLLLSLWRHHLYTAKSSSSNFSTLFHFPKWRTTLSFLVYGSEHPYTRLILTSSPSLSSLCGFGGRVSYACNDYDVWASGCSILMCCVVLSRFTLFALFYRAR